MPSHDDLRDRLAAVIAGLGVEAVRSGPDEWAVAVPSEIRGEISVIVNLRESGVRLSSFLMRRPDRNHGEVATRLMRRNLRTWLWRFALDDDGDLFLVADLPVGAVDEVTLDRALGAFSVLVDESYETTVRSAFDVPQGTRFGPPPP